MVAPLRIAFCALVPAIAALSFASSGFAAKKISSGETAKPADARTVELFDAIKNGDLTVGVIPKNEFQSTVRVTNNTRQPLTVKLPKAVAAVQVFKQVFGPGGNLPGGMNNGNNLGNGNNAGRGQNTGGQLGNGGNQNGLNNPFGNFPGAGNGNGIGNGFFSVPAEKTVIFPLHTVCLEHGKPTPNVRMTYELRPLRNVVDDPALERLLAAFHPKKSDRRAVQAAAWHLADKMTWKQLRAKNVRHIGGRSERYFSLRELRTAFRMVETVKKDAKGDESRPDRTRLTRR